MGSRLFSGYLAHDNAPEIRARFERMLYGRPYTWVDTNADLRNIPPKVRTTQRLVKPPKLAGPGHVMCHDAEYVWGIHSSYHTERDVVAAIKAGAKDWVAVTIDGDGTGRRDRIEIQQYNMMSPRELLHWVITPEHPEWDLPEPEEQVQHLAEVISEAKLSGIEHGHSTLARVILGAGYRRAVNTDG